MSHILLIDGNNIGYASMYVPALSRLQHNGQSTGGLMGLAQSVIRISALFPEAVPVVLWDGHAGWRKELCPEYKENRKDTPEKVSVAQSWRQQQPWAAALLMQMGVLQARAMDAEADDLAGRLTHNTEAFGDYGIDRITLASGDTDWWQALSDSVDWLSPITDKSVTLETLRSDGVKDGPFESPYEYLLAKAIAGDASDNIPGVPGVGITTALKLLRHHGGLDGIGEAVANGSAKDQKSQAITKHRETIERNRTIMDWSLAPASSERAGFLRLSFAAAECADFCAGFGLNRLADRLQPHGDWALLVSRHIRHVPAVCDYIEAHA